MESRSVRFFTNTCRNCCNDIPIPLLGDFSYGEFLFQTEDGAEFGYAAAILEPAWEAVSEIVTHALGIDLKKVSPAIDRYHAVMRRCADPIGGKRFTDDFPICPICLKPMRNYGDSRVSHDATIPSVSYSRFMELSSDERSGLVIRYWKEMG